MRPINLDAKSTIATAGLAFCATAAVSLQRLIVSGTEFAPVSTRLSGDAANNTPVSRSLYLKPPPAAYCHISSVDVIVFRAVK